MKNFLGYIMAFMVLAFSLLPCADGAPAVEGKASHELVKKMPQHSDGDNNDACSPFCICSCCTGFSITAKLLVPFTITPFVETAFTFYIPDRLYSIAFPIWQPPQLV